MVTECSGEQLVFQGIGTQRIEADFEGGRISSDPGGLLLAEVERRCGYLTGFAECFVDGRDERRIEHSVRELIFQRILGLCLGYEDLNDHDRLRTDALLAAVCGKKDPQGRRRREERDRGKGLAGRATLNRLELTPAEGEKKERYKKIRYDGERIADYFVRVFLEGHRKPPRQLILDLDATDDPLHGRQEGRFFHGYYDCYCYLPLYVFCAEELLCAKLRRANIDACAGALEEIQRIVAMIRARWPRVRIILRADSGFCREELMGWAEQNGVDYLFGLARNSRLVRTIQPQMQRARRRSAAAKKPARVYRELRYRTRESWTRSRRVVAKAEYLEGKENPRFIVSSLPAQEFPAQKLYEGLYCQRGDMENRIKEQQLYLFADRTSAATMRANQLRLWFSSVAYVMLSALRRLGLKSTEMAHAQCDTIRLKLLKIGAQVRFSVRRILVSIASGYPYQSLFRKALANLRANTA
jgi:hypothetical protein